MNQKYDTCPNCKNMGRESQMELQMVCEQCGHRVEAERDCVVCQDIAGQSAADWKARAEKAEEKIKQLHAERWVMVRILAKACPSDVFADKQDCTADDCIECCLKWTAQEVAKHKAAHHKEGGVYAKQNTHRS